MTDAAALAITAKVAALTIQHMAEQSGATVDQVLVAISQPGAARDRFIAYMDVAKKELT